MMKHLFTAISLLFVFSASAGTSDSANLKGHTWDRDLTVSGVAAHMSIAFTDQAATVTNTCSFAKGNLTASVTSMVTYAGNQLQWLETKNDKKTDAYNDYCQAYVAPGTDNIAFLSDTQVTIAGDLFTLSK